MLFYLFDLSLVWIINLKLNSHFTKESSIIFMSNNLPQPGYWNQEQNQFDSENGIQNLFQYQGLTDNRTVSPHAL